MAAKPPRVINVDEVEALSGPGTLMWKPIRFTLGVRAFGCNAYVADRPGRELIEPHSENPALAHEELYYVARGRASFTIDGEQYDAGEGTYVFVPDPASHRAAVAAEPDTLVLSFGGPPTFEPSAWEWTFRAAALARSDPAAARQILEEGLAAHPESPSIRYQLACQSAIDGDSDAALERLAEAVELEPGLVDSARGDGDFDSVRQEPDFLRLIGDD
ncbi:MAG TPA: cupin domain-containing protein [Solirubrobacteraceae bacterium]|nr:cupin domain-containing protein [Solirubrobacteraceae bacterium]